MVIVLVHWKIKPACAQEFLEFWRQEAVVQDRRGLVGEFLSEACHTSEFPWITWDLTGREGQYRSFLNVGLWHDTDDFHRQVAMYFNDQTAPKSFEFERRVRTIMRPQCWRMGDARLPVHDSGGVL